MKKVCNYQWVMSMPRLNVIFDAKSFIRQSIEGKMSSTLWNFTTTHTHLYTTNPIKMLRDILCAVHHGSMELKESHLPRILFVDLRVL